MDKKEIVKILLKNKIMVTPEALDNIKNIDDVNRIIKNNPDKIVIDIKENNIENKKPEENNNIYDISFEFLKKGKDIINISDVVEMRKSKFDVLKKIISSKINAISIKNLNNIRGDAWIIGEIIRIDDEYYIEDFTGKTKIDKIDGMEAGDVVGVEGFYMNDKFTIKNIVYPDIPIINTNKIDFDIAFNMMVDNKLSIIFSDDSDENGIKNNTIKIKRKRLPLWIKIKDSWVLIFEGEYSEENIVEMLKKRIIKKSFLDFIVIDKKPDMIVVLSKNKIWNSNYKGVVLISLNKNTKAFFNASNMSVEFVDKT